jgi:Concanavalin A-like lectin/glucanases superfamily
MRAEPGTAIFTERSSMRKAVTVLVSIGALIAAPAASANVGLSGWWPFYENSGTVAHDASPYHDNGTVSGSARWVGGYFGSALGFDGSPAAVRVPNQPAFEPATHLTVTAFVKASTSPGNYDYIVSKGGSGCLTASYGLYTGPNGGIMFYVSHDTTSFTRSPDGGAGVWDGNWHFLVGTYDGSAVRLYVDGTQVGNGTPDSAPIGYNLTDTNDLYIGQYPSCDNLEFTGAIDEPTVWNQTLTPLEVSASYKALVLLHHFVSRLAAFPGS